MASTCELRNGLGKALRAEMTFSMTAMASGFLCWAFVPWMLAFPAARTLFLWFEAGLWFGFLSEFTSEAPPLSWAASGSKFVEVFHVAARSFEGLLLIVDSLSLSNHLFGFLQR